MTSTPIVPRPIELDAAGFRIDDILGSAVTELGVWLREGSAAGADAHRDGALALAAARVAGERRQHGDRRLAAFEARTVQVPGIELVLVIVPERPTGAGDLVLHIRRPDSLWVGAWLAVFSGASLTRLERGDDRTLATLWPTSRPERVTARRVWSLGASAPRMEDVVIAAMPDTDDPLLASLTRFGGVPAGARCALTVAVIRPAAVNVAGSSGEAFRRGDGFGFVLRDQNGWHAALGVDQRDLDLFVGERSAALAAIAGREGQPSATFVNHGWGVAITARLDPKHPLAARLDPPANAYVEVGWLLFNDAGGLPPAAA